MAQTDQDTTPRLRRRRPLWRRIAKWLVGIAGVLAVTAGLMAVMLSQRGVRAPGWLRDRVEVQISRTLGDLHFSFRTITVGLGPSWQPVVAFRDLSLAAPDGRQIVQLADAEIGLDPASLVRGRILPSRVRLQGAFATLRRDSEGNFAFSLGDASAPAFSGLSPADLIGRGDAILAQPQLLALEQVELDALSLRYEDARQNRAWTLDGGRVDIARDDGVLTLGGGFSLLGGGGDAGAVELNYASRIGAASASFGMSVSDIPAGDIAAQSVALNWLEVLRAPISGALRGSLSESGELGPLSATLQIGSGVLQPTDDIRPIPFEAMRSYFTYDPVEQVLDFDELSLVSENAAGLAEGRAYLGGVSQGNLTDLTGQVRLSRLRINPGGVYTDPLSPAAASVDFRLDLDPFSLTLGEMFISDADTRIGITGNVRARPDGWALGLDAQISELTPERLVELWPEAAAAKPRKWVADNLSGGKLFNIGLALRARPAGKPVIHATFDYDDTTIRFLRSMPPITGAGGFASLDGGRFSTTARRGVIVARDGEEVDISGTSFIIPDVTIKKAAPGIVRATGSGSVTAIMALLNRPPLEVLKGTPLPVTLADGQAQVTGTLALPLKQHARFSEFEFHLDGDIRNVSSSVLVPGQSATASELHIKGDQTGIELSGQAKVGDLPVDLRWRQPLGEGVGKQSRVQGTFELSPLTIDTFNIALPPGMVTGRGRGAFSIDLGTGAPPYLTVGSSLEGVGLNISALGWSKPPALAGRFELAGALGKKASFDRLVLKAAGLDAIGSLEAATDGGLERANFSSVRLGDWMDVRAQLLGRPDGPPDVRVTGGVLDMRKADFGSGGSSQGGGGLRVALDRLQVTDTIALAPMSGNFTTASGLSGTFTGQVNGETAVGGQVVPQSGRSAFRIQSQDAGGVFRSAGILQQGRGGVMNLVLLPASEPGKFDGSLRVTNTRIQDAPAIAALLNSISVVGLLDEMTGKGILFSEVDAKFLLGPSQLVLYSSSAEGPSIGMSMDGRYDVNNARLDMQGVVSPVYLLNSVGSVLTRKGEGVFGFNYTLSGPVQDPVVQVNPLSALTPGMFREIFREAPPQPELPEGEVPKPPRRAPDPTDGSTGGR